MPSRRVRATILDVPVAPGARLGVDLVARTRLERAATRSGPGLLAEIFTEAELAQLGTGVGRTAGERFAIKEAVHKALRTRLLSAVAVRGIDTSPDDGVVVRAEKHLRVDVVGCVTRESHALAVVCVTPTRAE